MSFTQCIQDKAKSGVLKAADVKALENEYNDLVAQYSKTMGDAVAAQKAAMDFVAIKRSRLTQKRRNEISAALTQASIIKEVDVIKARDGVGTDVAWTNIMERAYSRKEGVLREAYSSLNEFVEQYSSKAFGLVTSREGIKDVVREMLGANTGNKVASGHGKALRETFDLLHARYKNTGGIIGSIDNYFPQSHQKDRISKVTFDEWFKELRPRLDMKRMIDDSTGLPFDDAKFKKVMFDDYEDIITNGRKALQKRADEGKQTFGAGSDISQRRQASRFYHFKDAESFLQYNAKFGLGDEGLYDTITGTIEMMSRDIGILEVLGAKPNAINNHMQLRMASEDIGVIRRGRTRGAYDILTGRTDTDLTDDSLGGRSINFLHNTQNVLRSALLGGASISAISDATFIVAATRMQGLSGVRAMGKYAKQMNPASSKDRKLAKRTGYISEIATQGAMQDARISGGDMLGNKLTSAMASFTNRASGLAAMTRAARNAVALEFQATLSDLQKVKWDDLPVDFKKAAEIEGFTPKDWSLIQKTELLEAEEGVTFLRQNEIALAGDDRVHALEVSNKLDDWITKTQNLATNEPTLRTRAITTGAAFGEAQKGTMLRTVSSVFFMFKSFPVTVLFNHVLPMFNSVKKGKYEHLATVVIGTTMLGGLSLQMNDIRKGREPRDMNDPKFLAAAMMKGGGLGLFGDFLFADYDRFGRDPISQFFTGATGGLASDVLKTFAGNLQKALAGEGDLDRFNRDVFNLVKQNTPAVNLWYSKLILERLLLDQIEESLDSKFHKRKKAMERKRQKDYGTGYWWGKGNLTPNIGR